MSPISKFERLAQRLVEGSFSRLLGGQLEPLEVATRIAQALEDDQAQGRASDTFAVHLHPADLAAIAARHAAPEQVLGAYVNQLAREGGLRLPGPVTVELVADDRLRTRQVWVEPAIVLVGGAEEEAANTQVFEHGATQERRVAVMQAVDAFLIVDGRHHVQLDKPIITIGRRKDNDIVLSVPTVSRQHAQIRWRYGHFVLYDLGSRAGTAVNGEPVQESVLQPGDVVTISTVPLIYGEGIDGRATTPRADSREERTVPMRARRPAGPLAADEARPGAE